MVEYTSFMKDTIYEFIKYKKASKRWNKGYELKLKSFDQYIVNNYENSRELTQEMIDSWCAKRDSELNKTRNYRIAVIISFLRYTNSRKITQLDVPLLLKSEKNTYRPHYFTEQELNNFFYACDNIVVKQNMKESKIKQLTIPAFFRLLYSTGMRTTEVRLLKTEDINFDNGVISINKSKGYDQHYVVLDDLMKEYLIDYNNKINILCPNRVYFFPGRNNGFYNNGWVCKNFKKYWKEYNNSHAIAYDLRHHYAITNINNWIDKGIDFTDKLYYLSKSMGHSNVETTKYYYTLIPRMSDIFKAQINDSFNHLVPEVKDNE